MQSARVQIKVLGISFHHRAKCAETTFQYYSPKAICTPTGLILVPQNYSELADLRVLQTFDRIKQSNKYKVVLQVRKPVPLHDL